jgi:L-seryl-tRNA(Ser) seleniumtransferase
MEDNIIRSRRDIPSVEILASMEEISSLSSILARPLIIEIIRNEVERFKEELERHNKGISLSEFQSRIITEVKNILRKKIGRVINGVGILVHTNLGRAPLPENLFDNIKSQIIGYGNLEFDVNSGKRGKRGELAEKYLALLSESEAACIVNNNAAALFLILNTLANKKNVIISRGELVQIGGGFRIPDIIKRAGAKLIEIGTTNITSYGDYKSALESNPALILKVHRSNFAMHGFVDEVDLKSLVTLGKDAKIPIINDLGSGVFIDTTEFAGQHEPTVQESVRYGTELTCFSGDKLLGGVQAGLIVGQKYFIDALKKNPVYRALRVDKIVFSALEELLGYYLNNTWKENIKLWRLAGRKESDLYQIGQYIIKEVAAGDKIVLEGSKGEMGGGSLPNISIPSVALVFRSKLTPQKVSILFRRMDPPVIGRVAENYFLIDLKAIDDNDVPILIDIIKKLKDSF